VQVVNHFEALSAEVLAKLLLHIPLGQRMDSCALVDKSWKSAAALTNGSINVSNADPASTASLAAWLKSHANRVPIKSIAVQQSRPGSKLTLPLAQLRSLQSLTLTDVPWEAAPAPAPAPTAPQTPAKTPPSSSTTAGRRLTRAVAAATAAAAAAEGQPTVPTLAVLTSLKTLQLTGTSVKLDGLSALTALQELKCACQHSDADEGAAAVGQGVPMAAHINRARAALMQALPQLQALASLEPDSELSSPVVLKHVKVMQQLQNLSSTKSDKFSSLPQSLTRLQLKAYCGPDRWQRPTQLSPRTAPRICQLATLQVLELQNIFPLDSAVLASISILQQLSLESVRFQEGESPPLLVFSKLTALKSLSIKLACNWLGLPSNAPQAALCVVASLTDAEAAALTASSQLTALHLGGLANKLRPQLYSSMFPAGRQLPNLLELSVSTDLLSNTAVLQHVASSCTSLTSLTFERVTGSGPGTALTDEAATELGVQLGQLGCFSKLEALQLCTACDELPPSVWDSLAGVVTATKNVCKLAVDCRSPNFVVVFTTFYDCKGLQELRISPTMKAGAPQRYPSLLLHPKVSLASMYKHVCCVLWCTVQCTVATLAASEAAHSLPHA
jgi:hypothetical protein